VENTGGTVSTSEAGGPAAMGSSYRSGRGQWHGG